MFKQKLLQTVSLTMAVMGLFLFTACGSNSEKEPADPTPSQTGVEEKSSSVPGSSSTETNPNPSEVTDNPIVKISGGADEVGIYSVEVKLTDQAADKGVIEMVCYGAKGSPQEKSVVNTFRIEYYKEPEGTFDVKTFFDGEVYQKLPHQNRVKVTNTFGATLRAGSVTVSYTPDGGTTQEVFRADAEYFYIPTV